MLLPPTVALVDAVYNFSPPINIQQLPYLSKCYYLLHTRVSFQNRKLKKDRKKQQQQQKKRHPKYCQRSR